jgi:hypothetical protein
MAFCGKDVGGLIPCETPLSITILGLLAAAFPSVFVGSSVFGVVVGHTIVFSGSGSLNDVTGSV